MNYRSSLIALSTLLTTGLMAQVDLSSYSASQRMKIAEEEQVASESDPVFQQLMTEGVSYFEDRQYEEAITRFEQANARRPVNVYPPVMIEDVKLAMLHQVEEVMEEVPEVEEPPAPAEPQLSAEERVERMYQAELAKVYKDMPPPPKKEKAEALAEPLERTAEGLIIIEDAEAPEVEETQEEAPAINETTSPEVPVEEPIEESTEQEEVVTPAPPKTELVLETQDESKSLEEIQEELAAAYPDGVTEEVFSEGNRTITKRVVVKDRVGNEYRKVKHGWGGIFYFKNGVSITERVWLQETILD